MIRSNEIVESWVAKNVAIIVPDRISNQFDLFLNNLPWNIAKTGIDWTKVGAREFVLRNKSDEEIVDFLAVSRLGLHSHLAFWYNRENIAVACPIDFAFRNIDTAFWKAPGRRYMFGVDISGDVFIENFDHFAEYDGADTITVAELQ